LSISYANSLKRGKGSDTLKYGDAIKVGDSVKFSCPSRYRLNGVKTSRCNLVGHWDALFPRCDEIFCSEIPAVSDGSAVTNNTELFSIGKSVGYNCNAGYQLVGTGSVTCLENGTWSSSRTICRLITCPEPQKIANGKLVEDVEIWFSTKTNNYTPGYLIQYVCDVGYTMTGFHSVLRCSGTGIWNSTAPECRPISCLAPSLPANIIFDSVEPRVYKTKGYYRCALGYVLIGSSETECSNTGDWTGAVPICKPISCPPPGEILNGLVNGSKHFYSDTIHYFCNEGYTIIRNSTRRCESSSTWSGVEPACVPVTCPNPQTLEHGVIVGQHHTFNKTIEFICNSGFNLVGSLRIVCAANGTWSDHQPTCRRVECVQLIALINGSSLGSAPYHPGSVVQYSCKEGFEFNGKDSRSCLPDGSWTGPTPKCNLIVCPQLGHIKNGRLLFNETSYSSIVEYQCDNGYELDGFAKRNCTAGRLWTGSEPICKVANCSMPERIQHGSIFGDSYSVGKSILYKCDVGYKLEGHETRTCRDYKIWNVASPRCVVVECDKPADIISNGRMIGSSYTYGASIEYKCDDGYVLDGLILRTCNASGMWDNTIPICERVKCPQPVNPLNGYAEGYNFRFKENLTYSCRPGYNLVGTNVRQCQANKTWSGLEPTCIAIECQHPGNITNGNILLEGLHYIQFARYQCKSGYQLQGADRRECYLNGRWSDAEPMCVKVVCETLPVIVHGIALNDQVNAGSTLEFSCDEGYRIVDQQKLTCTQFGNFSGETPNCQKVFCPKPALILNGNLEARDIGFGDVVTYRCDLGYELIGQTKQSCLDSGQWSGVPPSCGKITCPAPEYVPNAILKSGGYDYGARINYECAKGYKLEHGSTERICQENKVWSGSNPFCIQIACQRPQISYGYVAVSAGDKSIEKHVREIDRYVFGMVVYFDCEEGFILRGLNEIECLINGSWSGAIATCDRVQCGAPNISHSIVSAPRGFTFGYRTIVSCEKGYDIVGLSDLYCSKNGSWSSRLPSCKAVSCVEPVADKHLEIKILSSPNEGYSYKTKIGFNCSRGFELEGILEALCLSNGRWSETFPKCKLIVCSPPLIQGENLPILENFKDLYTFGENLTFKCSTGYELVGYKEIICNENKQWNGTVPICKPILCPSLHVNNSLTFTNVSNYPVGFILSIKCESGYRLLGVSQVICSEYGDWLNETPRCERVMCPLVTLTNGKVIGDRNQVKYTFNDSVIYTCNEGYALLGVSTARCLESGVWSFNASECAMIVCPTLNIDGGNIMRTRKAIRQYRYERYERDVEEVYKPGDIVDVTCDSGYTLITNQTSTLPVKLSCNATGSWSGVLPRCEILCPEPKVNHSSIQILGATNDELSLPYSFGSVIKISCSVGYTFNGLTDENLCQSDGQWSEKFPSCEIVKCPLLRIANATFSGVKNTSVMATYNSSMRVECLIGFELFGDRELICQAEGQWFGLMPICLMVACKVPNISHAKFINTMQASSKFNYGEGIQVACVSGYELKGSSEIMCNANKSWTPQLPVCEEIYCTLPSLNGSRLNYVKEGGINGTGSFPFGTEVQFECELGYIVEGKATIKCEANKSWSDKVPGCNLVYCPMPFVRNGSFKPSLTAYNFGHSIRLMCNPGFNKSGGETEIFCQPNGEWTAEFITCIRLSCSDIPQILHGVTVGKSSLFESIVTYICDIGYEIAGNENITCMSNLQWSTPPTCLAVRCPVPNLVRNGEYKGNTFTYGNVLSYICHIGYEINGVSDLTCLSSSKWSDVFPACVRVNCSQPPYVPHVDLIGVSHMYGDLLTLKCHDGYRLKGNNFLSCQSNRSWSLVQGHCQIVTCGDLSYIQHATTVRSVKHDYNSTAKYICNQGYDPIGTMETTCLANGSWTLVKAECVRIKCPFPDIVKNGSLYIDGKNVRVLTDFKKYWPTGFVYNDKIRYICDKGHEVTTVDTQICTSEGSWNGTIPSCELIICPNPPKLFNANYSLPPIHQIHTFGHHLNVDCIAGFLQKKAGRVECTEFGTWNISEIFCEKVACSFLSSIQNGSIKGTDFSYGGSVSFSCLEGFKLIGHDSLTCDIRGLWNGTLPHCAVINCSKIYAIDNGYIDRNDVSYRSIIVHHCFRGYELIGDATRTCQADGQWTGRPVHCKIRQCLPLGNVLNGKVISSSATSGSSAEYTCNLGYEIHGGSKHLLCDQNGLWTGSVPECKIIVCIDPLSLKNGYFIGSSYLYDMVVTYHCKEFYTLIGNSQRTCKSDKTWSGILPTCSLKLCRIPPKELHRRYIGDEYYASRTILFQCDEGYRLVGNKTLTCLDGISWSSGFPKCEQIVCSRPASIEYGKINVATSRSYTFGDVMKYACISGYELQGLATIQCQLSGNWSEVFATCERISCPDAPQVAHAHATQQGHRFRFNDVVFYICDQGYHLTGNNLINCAADKQWAGALPKCELITCGSVPVIHHASTIVRKTTFGSKAFYECNRGYELIGSAIVVCEINGRWAYADKPECKPLDCGQSILTPINGGVNLSKTTFGNTATFYCLSGFYLTGSPVVDCGEQGTWNAGFGILCNPISCAAPEPVLNGRLDGSDYKLNHRISYSCSEGYKLTTDYSSRICQPDGTWSGSTPLCNCKYFINYTSV